MITTYVKESAMPVHRYRVLPPGDVKCQDDA